MDVDRDVLARDNRQISILMEMRANQALAEHELTAVQACTLRFILCRTLQGTAPTEIHKAFGCSMATLSSVVKRLKEKGYVRAECCAGDDRCKLLFATEKGQRVHADLDSTICAAEQRIYGCFSTEELLTLDRLQQKLLKNLVSLIKSDQKEAPNS